MRRERVWTTLVLSLCLALPLACDDDDSDSCSFGDLKFCGCDGGVESTMACRADGSGFEACDCPTAEELCNDVGDKEIAVRATVEVPADFSGEPVGLITSFNERLLPIDDMQIPAGVGLTDKCIELDANGQYTFETFARELAGGGAPLVGEYYMTVMFYVKGGGMDGDPNIPLPVGGVDYIGRSTAPKRIEPGKIADMGVIALEPWPEDIVIELDGGV